MKREKRTGSGSNFKEKLMVRKSLRRICGQFPGGGLCSCGFGPYQLWPLELVVGLSKKRGDGLKRPLENNG